MTMAWDTLYRQHGPQRPYARRPGLDREAPTGAIEYAGGALLRLADLCPPQPNWRESTDGSLRELVPVRRGEREEREGDAD